MTPKRPARSGQARGKRTRENLLQAAIQSMVDSHIYGLRFAQISKIANVPQPLMDYHFPSLEVLLLEMVTFQLERLKVASVEAIEKQSANPRRALAAYIRAPFLLSVDDPGFRAVWSCYYHLATVNRSFAEFNRGVRSTGTQRIGQLVAAVVAHEDRQGFSTKKVNDVALAIQGIITGFAHLAAGEPETDYRSLADLAVKASGQVLAAHFPEKA